MREICLDMTNGLPESIDFSSCPDVLDTPQADIEEVFEGEPAFFRVDGYCMEAAGIEDGGYVLVDFTRFPQPPRYKSKGGDGSYDCCLCSYAFTDSKMLCVKAYSGKWGSLHSISTKYAPEHNPHPPMQSGWFAEKIYGVVIASYGRDGRRIWARDPEEFSDHLIEESTIHGEGIGDPIIL